VSCCAARRRSSGRHAAREARALINSKGLHAVVWTTAVAVSIALPVRGAGREALAPDPDPVAIQGVAGHDRVVRHDVKTALGADPVLEGAHIAVSARDGHVTLAGVVTSEAQRQRALALAWGTRGVRLVDNALDVLPVGLP
jgi:hyperosmotically inducible protein